MKTFLEVMGGLFVCLVVIPAVFIGAYWTVVAFGGCITRGCGIF